MTVRHTVRDGDTIGKIASYYHVSEKALFALNTKSIIRRQLLAKPYLNKQEASKIGTPDLIFPGTVLDIPER